MKNNLFLLTERSEGYDYPENIGVFESYDEAEDYAFWRTRIEWNGDGRIGRTDEEVEAHNKRWYSITKVRVF